MSGAYEILFEISSASNTASCRLCDATYKFNAQATGYSTLKRHAETKHGEEFQKAQLKDSLWHWMPSMFSFSMPFQCRISSSLCYDFVSSITEPT